MPVRRVAQQAKNRVPKPKPHTNTRSKATHRAAVGKSFLQISDNFPKSDLTREMLDGQTDRIRCCLPQTTDRGIGHGLA